MDFLFRAYENLGQDLVKVCDVNTTYMFISIY